jgi:hypothetical protein
MHRRCRAVVLWVGFLVSAASLGATGGDARLADAVMRQYRPAGDLMRRARSCVIAMLILAAPGSSVRSASAAEPAGPEGATVWAGVYTDAQAGRGKTQYEASCSPCHRGGPRTSEPFMRDWSGSDVDGLFRQIKSSMPAGAPSSLSDQTYLEIVAFVLQANGFPSGSAELDVGALKGIRIEGKGGPEPVPNFALVQAIGCLSAGSSTTWILADASEPVRTKDPAASSDGALPDWPAAPGTQTFELMNVYPRPDALKGHKVEAKGFLIREPGGNRINVTSVRSVAPRCGNAN